MLVPEKDRIIELYHKRRDIILIAGSENDVLSRYKKACDLLKCNYMVRITSDCPLLPPYIISRHIMAAVDYGYDYISNVHPLTRTAADGWDCEVISKKLIDWVDKNASKKEDREHVTTKIRDDSPLWAKIGNTGCFGDWSHLKVSVDTQEELEYVRAYHRIWSKKIELMKSKEFGDGFHLI